MKKSILLIAAVFSMAIMVTSCKEAKKEEVKHEKHENVEHKESALDKKEEVKEVYQCPMDCEKGKTYDKEGSCPKCKMDLKKVSNDQALNVSSKGCKSSCSSSKSSCKEKM